MNDNTPYQPNLNDTSRPTIIKDIIIEDFVNYKKPCMTIMTPYCIGFKCGQELCQNSELATTPNVIVTLSYIITSYMQNPITEAICFQGLEPFDSPDIFYCISDIRKYISDDIVIYSGYTEQELSYKEYLSTLKKAGQYNIILKVGRYIPNRTKKYDDVLGVTLASDNQYAMRIC